MIAPTAKRRGASAVTVTLSPTAGSVGASHPPDLSQVLEPLASWFTLTVLPLTLVLWL